MNKKIILVNKLTRRKAQITLFIILGIIILIIFWFTYQFVSSSTQQRMQTQVERAVKDIISFPALKFTIEGCLKDALEDGLILIGNQGGYIFPGQPGSIIPWALTTTGENTTYLILNSSSFQTPAYPCLSYAEEPDFCRFRLNDTPSFSRAILQWLYKPSPYSIQEQLEQYIANRTVDCTNLTDTIHIFFPQYQVNEKGIEANVRFGADTVSVAIDWPIEIKIAGQTPALQAVHFELDKPLEVRFRKIHKIVSDITEQESTNLSYNVLTPPTAYEGMQISRIGDSSVFTLNDTKSTIRGTAYTFKFARQNRAPVLDYINRYPHLQPTNENPLPDLYDWLAIEGETINITANAIEPDEENIGYALVSWTGSGNWQNQAQNYQYITNSSDVNWHNITVYATDPETASDSQKVRILVDNLLRTNAILKSPYSDTGNFVSLEDPIILNASPTIKTLDPYATYTFIWIAPGISITTSNPCMQIPKAKNCSETQNITDMSGHLTDVPPATISSSLNATLIYPGGFSQSNKTYFNVELKQCLPHRSSSPPYPYNTTSDPFQANHTCCNLDYTIANKSVICHNAETFFCPASNPTLLFKNTTPVHCDGTRGNICNGKKDTPVTTFTGLCGNSSYSGCQNPDPELVYVNNLVDHCGCKSGDGECLDLKTNKKGTCKLSWSGYKCKTS